MQENEEIKKKAEYCLNCKAKPCQKGCPLHNDIPHFIDEIRKENYEQAYKILSQTTVFQSVCGRICPHSEQCQSKCVRSIKGKPVDIGELEAMVGDMAVANNWDAFSLDGVIKKNKKVAVIGGGPTGLACTAKLIQQGYDVTIFEKHDYLGGLLRHGIPDFRLNRAVLDKCINNILKLGVEVYYNKELTKNMQIDDLKKKYDAIFLSFGANISSSMKIEGEELEGVYGANELLEYKKHPNYEGKKVIVIGGGNVAMDVSRTIKKLNPLSVKVLYRRSKNEMPAEEKEIELAMQEGVEFVFKTNIISIKGNKKVREVECIKTELIKKENEERYVPVNIEGSNYYENVDYVIMALGSKTEKAILNKLNLELDLRGYIKIDENYKTSCEKVFAGGDLIGTKATVAWAAKTGLEAAEKISELI